MASGALKDLALRAQKVTRQYFGRTMGLYAPLYISNYCENNCLYCGFNSRQNIPRKTLSIAEIRRECLALSRTGIQNILILTGESRVQAPVAYIKEAVQVSKEYFPNISLEIYPLETTEYRELYLAGADSVAIYQETYDRERYGQLHLSGRKKDYDFRYGAPARIAEAGIRSISLGVLLGLADWRQDIKALFDHLRHLENNFPGVEYSLSFPRLQMIGNDPFDYTKVSDREMIEIIATARLLFPRVGINLSTREKPAFRDGVLGFGITRMSAGSLTTVGGYSSLPGESEPGQFTVNDERSLSEIRVLLAAQGYDPVLTDWRGIINE
jgi:2-iminoacetate synthase